MPNRQPIFLEGPLPLPPLMRAHSDSGDIFSGERFRGLPWAIQPCACCGGTRSKLPTKDGCSLTKECTVDGVQGTDFWQKRCIYLECELKRASAANNKLMAKVVDLAQKINELTVVMKEKENVHTAYKKASEDKAAEGYSTISKLQTQLADIKQRLEIVQQDCSILSIRPNLPTLPTEKLNQIKSNEVAATMPSSDLQSRKLAGKNGMHVNDNSFLNSIKGNNGLLTEDSAMIAECYLLALENSPVVVAHMDLQLRYTWTANFSLYGQKEVLGKRDHDILPPGTMGIEEAIEIKQRAISTGQQQKGEIQWRANGRDPVVWVLTAQPLRDETGTIIGVAIAAMDVTAETLFRERLMVVRAEMMIRSATEQELQRASMMAEEAKSAKSMFLAIMSHEIRTPLNGMLGLADALLVSSLPSEQKELVKEMKASGTTMSDILSDLLDLASVETGTMKLNEITYNPFEMVDRVVNMATSLTRDKSIEVKCEIGSGLPSQIFGDESKVRQVLKCLVLNAVKFTQKGYIKIKLGMVDYDPTTVLPRTASFSTSSPGSGNHPLPHLPSVTEEHLRKLCRLRSLEIIGPLLSDIPTEGVMNDDRIEYDVNMNGDDFWTGPMRIGLARRGSQLPFRNDSITTTFPSDFPDRNKKHSTKKEKNAAWLTVEVSDSGVGIPEEAFSMLFEKFTQVSSGPTRNYGGTGLGLAICKQLVELMGGHLTVSSKVNHGSTFSFSVQCKIVNESNGNSINDSNSNKNTNVNRRNLPKSNTDRHNSPSKNSPLVDSPSPSPPISTTLLSRQPSIKKVSFRKVKVSLQDNVIKDSIDEEGEGEGEGEGEIEGSEGGQRLAGRLKERDEGMGEPGEKKRLVIRVPSRGGVTGKERKEKDTIDEGDEGIDDRDGKIQEEEELKTKKERSGASKTIRWRRIPRKEEDEEEEGGGEEEEDEIKIERKPREERRREVRGRITKKETPAMGSSDEKKTTVMKMNNNDANSSSHVPKILLVEDSKVNVMVANSMLKRLGLKPALASNGVEAMEAIKKEKYDLVLLDICMPLMDGLQTAFLIRQYEETGVFPEEEVKKAKESNVPAGDEKQASAWTMPEGGVQNFTRAGSVRLPIIAVTANALAADQERCFAVGMDAFIAKPIQFPTLKDTMSRFVNLPAVASVKSRTSSMTSANQEEQSSDLGSESRSESLQTPPIPPSSMSGLRTRQGSGLGLGSRSLMSKPASEVLSRTASEVGSEVGKSSLNEGLGLGEVIMSPKSSFNNSASSIDAFESSLADRMAERKARNASMANNNPSSYLPPVYNLPSSNASPLKSRLRHANSLPASAIHALASNKPASSSSRAFPSSSSVINQPFTSSFSTNFDSIPKPKAMLPTREKTNGIQQQRINNIPSSSSIRENETFNQRQQQKQQQQQQSSSSPSPSFSFNNNSNGNDYEYKTPKAIASPSSSLSHSPDAPSRKVHVSVSRPPPSARPSSSEPTESSSDFITPTADRRRFTIGSYDSSVEEDTTNSVGSRSNATASVSTSRWKAAAYVSRSGERGAKGEDRMAALINARLESLHSKHSKVSPQQIPKPNIRDYENYSHRSMFQ